MTSAASPLRAREVGGVAEVDHLDHPRGAGQRVGEPGEIRGPRSVLPAM